MWYMPQNTSVHHVERFDNQINARVCQTSIENAIANGWYDAGSHQVQSHCQRNMMFFAELGLKATKIVPASTNSEFNSLFLKIII